MKITKTVLLKAKKETTNKLTKNVIDYVLDRFNDYDNKEAIFTDVLNYGCQSGIVGSLVYYSDTVKYYNKYKEEINALLYETLWGCGYNSPSELFGSKWDKEDPLALGTQNQNLLAWFGFEEEMRGIASDFEIY